MERVSQMICVQDRYPSKFQYMEHTPFSSANQHYTMAKVLEFNSEKYKPETTLNSWRTPPGHKILVQ